MKQILKKACRRIVTTTLGLERTERLFTKSARLAGLDLLKLAYHEEGILRYENFTVSGERSFWERYVLPCHVGGQPTIFDIGANVGDYSIMIVEGIQEARVFSFEPNPETFKLLQSNLAGTGAKCVNLGMGSREESRSLFVYPDQISSPHASVNRELLSKFHMCAEPKEIKCSFSSVDDFCQSEGIERIDLLKVDAEGHELDIISGAQRMIEQKRVDCIQFEFGECDVYSRVFLRDFYEKLPFYSFFRICSRGLISLGKHSPRHEIFQYQNIVAVQKASRMAREWGNI